MENKNNKKIRYEHEKVESKWSKIWEENHVNKTDLKGAKKPYYNLMMYPYPSAEGLHVGNMYAFTGSDIHGRYKRMQGYDVFEPIGFDSGGIHSENFAIKMGVHPKEMTERNIANFTKQLKMTGNMYDWDHVVDVMNPDYYKWTQWIFIKLFEKGLAYRKASCVTWCPSCKTTVSDEQTETKNGKTVCERCKTEIERKKMKQWFFKITDYAERLLDNTNKLNWPSKVLTTQRNWIGKSEGAEINFKVSPKQPDSSQESLLVQDDKADLRSVSALSRDEMINVFTTRPDTLYGCTFFVLAPEHRLIEQIVSKDQEKEVMDYVAKARKKTEQDRKMAEKDKTGVFTGGYVVNPVNGEKVPVWVADYVLMGYGEGAVMGVPAHDERDFEFARKFNLDIIPVVDVGVEYDKNKWQEIYHDKGVVINSDKWDGKKYPENLDEIIKDLEDRGIGSKKVTFKLRDWCISRQRYWGPPIPMIHCDECGWVAVPEKDLPVLLPDIDDYLPDGSGKSPLHRHREFTETTCPKCGVKAERESDVSDTFLDSSWYFLRYPSTAGGDISKEESESGAFLSEINKRWLPVTQYCGGSEHAVLHLMYSRFITMVLHDMGYLDFEEPFPNFYAHGLIIKDGAKMSKSKGNVINPDVYIKKYGADVFRMYLSFIGPYGDGGDFRDSGIAGTQKFIGRIWRLFNQNEMKELSEDDKKSLESLRHQTIKKVTKGIERFKYNTAIAGLMVYLREMERVGYVREDLKTFALLLAPFAPYICEELWSGLSHSQFSHKKHGVTRYDKLDLNSVSSLSRKFRSVMDVQWPEYDESKLVKDQVTIVVQVNGKVRANMEIAVGESKDQEKVIRKAKELEELKKYIEGKEIKREIFVAGKLVNFVV